MVNYGPLAAEIILLILGYSS